ncbi:MAG TPA: RES domain-containing protein, partial [Pseudomonadales bacterium]|nr:RES domain-containing protein [Pseudomonadales bacterium]
MEIWTACQAEVTLRPLDGILLRMVESQEQVATTALVDDLTEQALLERMLER